MSDENPVPKRRLQLRLDLGADTLDDLVQALENIGTDLTLEGREDRETTWSGWSDGWHLRLTCDPDQTGDRFREQLDAWRQRNIESRGSLQHGDTT